MCNPQRFSLIKKIILTTLIHMPFCQTGQGDLSGRDWQRVPNFAMVPSITAAELIWIAFGIEMYVTHIWWTGVTTTITASLVTRKFEQMYDAINRNEANLPNTQEVKILYGMQAWPWESPISCHHVNCIYLNWIV